METLPDTSTTATAVAGRRLVRRLGDGEAWTAYSTVLAQLEPTGGDATGSTGPAADAVLLRARADAAERDLWRRAAILSRLDHPHILRLVDVAEDPAGLPCLLVERLSGGTLGELLRRRQTIAPGEAVTILAPLIDAVRAAHLAGIGHGGITASAVRFADDGRPVLTGWSRAAPVDPVTAANGIGRIAPAFAADWMAFAAVTDGVLVASDPDAPATTAWTEELLGELADHEVANRLQQRIHALARPLPVLLDQAEVPSASPADVIRATADRSQGGTSTPVTRRAAIASTRQARPGSRLRGALAWRPGRTAAAAAAEQSAPSVEPGPSRRRLLIGAAGAAALLVTAAMVLLPAEETSTAVGPEPSGLEAPVSALPSDPAPADQAPIPPTEQVNTDDVITGDDPAAATRELVRLRDQCRATGEESCIWESIERGSPFDDDERLGAQVGPIDAASLELVDRQGDAAVLRGTATDAAASPASTASPERRQPVTLLVVRGETGWRLREVFTAG